MPSHVRSLAPPAGCLARGPPSETSQEALKSERLFLEASWKATPAPTKAALPASRLQPTIRAFGVAGSIVAHVPGAPAGTVGSGGAAFEAITDGSGASEGEPGELIAVWSRIPIRRCSPPPRCKTRVEVVWPGALSSISIRPAARRMGAGNGSMPIDSTVDRERRAGRPALHGDVANAGPRESQGLLEPLPVLCDPGVLA